MGSCPRLRVRTSNYLRMVSFKQMKTCRICNTVQNIDSFRIYRGYVRGECRECENKIERDRRAKNPERYAAAARKWSREHPGQRNATKKAWRLKNLARHNAIVRKSNYGLTDGQYKILLDRQEWRCAICRGTERFSVDHCHASGQVRGILCCHCNRGLGGFLDSIPAMERAIEYLQKSRR